MGKTSLVLFQSTPLSIERSDAVISKAQEAKDPFQSTPLSIERSDKLTDEHRAEILEFQSTPLSIERSDGQKVAFVVDYGPVSIHAPLHREERLSAVRCLAASIGCFNPRPSP